MKNILMGGSVHDLCMGGVEQYLVNMLSQMDLSQYHIDILVPGKVAAPARAEQFERLGCRLIVLENHFSGDYSALRKLSYYAQLARRLQPVFKAKKYDLVHVNGGTLLYQSIFLCTAKVHGVPRIIAHAHNTIKGNLMHKCLRRFIAKEATDLWACSRPAAYSYFGHAGDKAQIMRNAIDTKRFAFSSVAREECRAELHIPQMMFVMGHVGRFTRQKNHSFLVDIFRAVCEKEPDVMMLLVGAGELKNEIHEKLRRYGLEDRVIFIGDTTELEKYYAAMDVFVFPSLYEGLGIVNIEAQASGLFCQVSEAVPPEADASGHMEFLSLGDAELWAEHILRHRNGQIDRTDAWKAVASAGYELSSAAEKMKALYDNTFVRESENMHI